jgi:hypothetical protein
VNSHLTTRQENERLKGIMARIESYDVVVSTSFLSPSSISKALTILPQRFQENFPRKKRFKPFSRKVYTKRV